MLRDGQVNAKNASENVVCFKHLLHIFVNSIGYCKERGKQCGPISKDQFDLGLHCLLNKLLKHFQPITKQTL